VAHQHLRRALRRQHHHRPGHRGAARPARARHGAPPRAHVPAHQHDRPLQRLGPGQKRWGQPTHRRLIRRRRVDNPADQCHGPHLRHDALLAQPGRYGHQRDSRTLERRRRGRGRLEPRPRELTRRPPSARSWAPRWPARRKLPTSAVSTPCHGRTRGWRRRPSSTPARHRGGASRRPRRRTSSSSRRSMSSPLTPATPWTSLAVAPATTRPRACRDAGTAGRGGRPCRGYMHPCSRTRYVRRAAPRTRCRRLSRVFPAWRTTTTSSSSTWRRRRSWTSSWLSRARRASASLLRCWA